MKNQHQELKHLGFMRFAAIQALICVSNLYDYAKRNSGPLRLTVGAVEDAVTTVISPVYQKFQGVPDHLLVFLDKKVMNAFLVGSCLFCFWLPRKLGSYNLCL